jgi:hypothetical protein
MQRYIAQSTHLDSPTLDLAERLFERFVGRRLLATEYEDHVKLVSSIGRLTHVPVIAITSVKATTQAGSVVPWAMDSVIQPNDVVEREGQVLLPSSLFGTSFDTATITYIAGLASIPTDVEACVLEIYRLIVDRTMDEWSGFQSMSDDAQATIQRWKEAN